MTPVNLIDTPLIDTRGMRCPWPVLRAAKALRAAESVIIVTDDPIAPAELAAFAIERGLILQRTPTALGEGFHLAPLRSNNA